MPTPSLPGPATLLARACAEPGSPEARRRSAWARVLKKVFEVIALRCRRGKTQMLVVARITQPEVIDRTRHIRAHFTDPTCAWAERRIAWMGSRWVLEYVRATPLRFRVETDAVKRAGLVSDLWQGYGALAMEAIYPNGFGGSSTRVDLPPR